MALVVTLALMVLMTFLVVAFLSKAQRARQAEGASAAGADAGELARSAADIIISDLQKEIVAGSDNKGTNDHPVYWPKDKEKWSPQNKTISSSDGTSLLVKQSKNEPFFDYGGDPSITGSSGVKTDTPSRNWRTVPSERWDKPRLVSDNSGTGPASFTSGNLPEWINVAERGLVSDAGNPSNRVTGRFAYNVYDLSGLPDIAVSGRPQDSNADDVYGASRIDLAGSGSFETVPGVNTEKWDNYMWWRFEKAFSENGTSFGEMAQDFPGFSRWAAELGSTPLYPADPNNATVRAAKEKRILSRQDLIRYIDSKEPNQTNRAMEPDILPFVRTHSASSNSPMWWPEDPTDPDFNQNLPPGQSNLDYRGNADKNDASNRFIPGVTVKSGFTRRDGTEAKAGEPLLKRRFPLSKLELVVTENATKTDKNEVLKYFGLDWDGGKNRWTYQKWGPGTTIMTLDEVAADNREPNFFELLKAGILSGSLGEFKYNTDGTDPYSMVDNENNKIKAIDENSDQQIFQIGASIIDQYDTDDIPTAILAPEEVAIGIENHPYIYNMFLSRFRRRDKAHDYESTGDPYNPQPWMTAYLRFQMWNPHANAQSEWDNPKDPTKNKKNYQYRIICVNDGETRVSMTRRRRDVYITGGQAGKTPVVVTQVEVINNGPVELISTAVPQKGRSIEFSGGVDSFTLPRLLASSTDQTFGAVKATSSNPENVYTEGSASMVGMWLGDVRADNNWEYPMWLSMPPLKGGAANRQNTYFRVKPGQALAAAKTVPNPYLRTSGPNGDRYYLNDYFAIGGAGQPEFDLYWDFPVKYELQVKIGNDWYSLQSLPPLSPILGNRNRNLINDNAATAADEVINPLDVPFKAAYDLGVNRHKNNQVKRGEWQTTHAFHNANSLLQTYDSFMLSDPRTSRFEFLRGRGYNFFYNLSNRTAEVSGVKPFTAMPTNFFPIPLDYTGMNGVSKFNGDNETNVDLRGWFEHPIARQFYPVPGGDDDSPTFSREDQGAALGEFVFNSKDRSCWYKERDGVTRRGDWGYSVEPNGEVSINPLSNNTTIRPVLLNRPFRSVAELGYTFRGEPWKSINFHGNDTADSALLDLFSIADSDTVKGRINLNKASENTLKAMIHEAASSVLDYELDANPGDSLLTPQQAALLAQAVRQRLDTQPIQQVSEIPALVEEILVQKKQNIPELTLWANPRTALARALADNADFRTWEMLIDVIAQAGRFPSALGSAARPEDFVVEGEERLWVHVSIDRLTGKVLDTQIETVQE